MARSSAPASSAKAAAPALIEESDLLSDFLVQRGYADMGYSPLSGYRLWRRSNTREAFTIEVRHWESLPESNPKRWELEAQFPAGRGGARMAYVKLTSFTPDQIKEEIAFLESLLGRVQAGMNKIVNAPDSPKEK